MESSFYRTAENPLYIVGYEKSGCEFLLQNITFGIYLAYYNIFKSKQHISPLTLCECVF